MTSTGIAVTPTAAHAFALRTLIERSRAPWRVVRVARQQGVWWVTLGEVS